MKHEELVKCIGTTSYWPEVLQLDRACQYQFDPKRQKFAKIYVIFPGLPVRRDLIN